MQRHSWQVSSYSLISTLINSPWLVHNMVVYFDLKEACRYPICPINEINLIMVKPLGSVCVAWIQCVVQCHLIWWSGWVHICLCILIPQGFLTHTNSRRKVINEWSGTCRGICRRYWLEYGKYRVDGLESVCMRSPALFPS